MSEKMYFTVCYDPSDGHWSVEDVDCSKYFKTLINLKMNYQFDEYEIEMLQERNDLDELF